MPIRWEIDERSGRLLGRGGPHELVLMPWPTIRAFSCPAGAPGAWEACRPEIRITPEPVAGSHGAFERWCSPIPPEVRRRVAAFRDRHWDVLAWVARVGSAAEDLVAASPALAYMLASARSFDASRDRADLVPTWALVPSRPQRSLLHRLGFPPTERVRRIVQKVVPEAADVNRLLDLRARLRVEENAERLAHVPRINATVLAVAAAGHLTRLTPRLLAEVSGPEHDDPEAAFAGILADTVGMWRAEGHRGRAPVFQGLDGLRRQHDALAERADRAVTSAAGPFPDPPVPGNDSIVPLLTAADLREEGRQQENCVASYARRAARGTVALYRVLHPQRCTLSLVRRRGQWVVDQLKARGNAPAWPHTRDAVAAWLAEGQRRAGGPGDGPPAPPGPRARPPGA